MRTGALTLHQAIRRAGASTRGERLTHCTQIMEESIIQHGRHTDTVRYACRTCGTAITHIDGHGSPASITPQQRHQLQASGETWTVETRPETVLNDRGPGGTSHA